MSVLNRISSEEFAEILQSESAYQHLIESLDSRSPLFFPEPKNFQMTGPKLFCPHFYRPLSENLVDKFVCYLLSLKKSYLHGYDDHGINLNCLNYIVKIFPLWVKWVQVDSLEESTDFLEAMTTIQEPSKEEVAEIKQYVESSNVNIPDGMMREARACYEKCSRLAGEYPPFSVKV